MPYEFKLPDLGEGLTEGEVARWLVAEGDEIAEDQPLVEIQTDKTTVEIPSPAAGTVTSIRAAEGDVVPVGTVLVVIGGDPAQTAMSPPPESALDMARVRPRPCPTGRGRTGHDRGQTPALSERDVAGGRVQATPLVRRIAQELGVPLESVAPTGPGRADHRGRRARVPPLSRRRRRRRVAAKRCAVSAARSPST